MMEYKANCGLDMALERQKPCLAGGRARQEGRTGRDSIRKGGAEGHVWAARKPRGGHRGPILNGLPPWDL